MKRSIYLILFLFLSAGMTGPVAKLVTADTQQEDLLKQAAAILTKAKYASYPQYDYKDVTISFDLVNGKQELSVRMNQVNNNPTGRFFFSSLSEKIAMVAVEWASGYDNNYVYDYTVIFRKSGDKWKNIIKNSYLTGHVEMIVDLDGDGHDELILKESTVNNAKNTFGGKYRLSFLNPEGKYETYWYTHLGTYGKRQDGNVVKNTYTRLDYITKEGQKIIVSTVDEGPGTQQVTGQFTWNGSELEHVNPDKRTHLIIQGKDIWVRDAPATGEVVMKLNDGDKCRILGKTGFEIIRGMADWWYQIEFEGKIGWVFGSQTDIHHYAQLVDEYVDFWEFYHDGLKDECLEQSVDGIFASEPGSGCDYRKISGNSFIISHNNEDGFIGDQHSLRKILNKELALVSVKRENAAASFCTYHTTKPAWFKNSAWNMRMSAKLNGVLDTLYQRSDGKYIIITRTNDYCGGGFGIEGMMSWTKWNVYLYDNSKTSPFQELQELGKFEFSPLEFTGQDEGTVFTDSLGIYLIFEPSEIRLELNEYKRKIIGDRFERMHNLTDKTSYYWDEPAMKFIKL